MAARALCVSLPLLASGAQLDVLTLPNWQRIPVGEMGFLEGGAVVARVDGPAAGFHNPAGLARLHRPSVSGALSVVDYTRTASRTNTGEARADDVGLKPNLVGFSSWWDAKAGVEEAGAGKPGFSLFLASPTTWSSTLEVRSNLPAGSRRDDGRSSFEINAAGVAAGRPLGRDWSVGAALEGWFTSYRYDAGASASDGATVLTSSFTEQGRSIAARAAVGVLWQKGSWKVGLHVRSPGLALTDNGEVKSATTSGGAAGSSRTEVVDGKAGFGFRLPWQVTLGVACTPSFLPSVTLEADLGMHGAVSRRRLFGPASGTTTTVNAGGSTTAPHAVPARFLDLRAVYNPSGGLAWRLPYKPWGRTTTVHLGGFIQRSPAANSETFADLDLIGGTLGASFAKGPVRVTLGGCYVASATLAEAIRFITSPQQGINPTLSSPNARFAVRSFVFGIGSTYEF